MGQHSAGFEVHDGLALVQHAARLRFDLGGEISQHFAQASAQMCGWWQAIHFGEGVIQREIAQILVENAKAHVGGAKKGGQQLLRLTESVWRGVGENAMEE